MAVGEVYPDVSTGEQGLIGPGTAADVQHKVEYVDALGLRAQRGRQRLQEVVVVLGEQWPESIGRA
jgi:hypothetical protein